MKNIIFLTLCSLILTSCYFGDNPSDTKLLTGNFYLTWFESEIDQNIIYSTVKNQTLGMTVVEMTVVEMTVFAVGYNDNFIIAKQHPDKSVELEERLYNVHARNSKEDFEVKNLDDTIYLIKGDKLYMENEKWFHTGRDFTSLPDSLKPNKGITYYHIIDTKKHNHNIPYSVYTLKNEKAFNEKRIELGVPENLEFTIVNKEME